MIDNERRTKAAAEAMVKLGAEHRAAGKPMPTRMEEARVALAAADAVIAETHWLAPNEATEEMTHAYGDPYEETVLNARELERIYDAMRDVYLVENKRVENEAFHGQ
ncbi:MAG: hypothetical protein A3E78_02805 [Alphaproteobacteria bacterium RIFCSPHIGHO2_12_FULL_63_12]|nr:MAG: hypothetical protein A3E78_02805 [Alphaproteobacteria bacterium RIFCSPHIGHO2_12_FULL_63_12]